MDNKNRALVSAVVKAVKRDFLPGDAWTADEFTFEALPGGDLRLTVGGESILLHDTHTLPAE